MSVAPLYCKNHPNVETLLRCNKCNDPYCMRDLVRTPVGYRCKTCLNEQREGYYSATLGDYAMVGSVGMAVSVIATLLAILISGFWLFAIFYAPVAGGAIAEAIWRATRRRRGRYVLLAGIAAFLFGTLIGIVLYPLVAILALGIGAPAFVLRGAFSVLPQSRLLDLFCARVGNFVRALEMKTRVELLCCEKSTFPISRSSSNSA